MPNNITSANAAQAITKLVATEFVEALHASFVMAPLVNRDYEAMIGRYGDTINVPIPPTLVANNILETGTVTLQNPSIGNAQIVLDTHAEASFQIADVARALAQPDLIKGYMEPAVIAMATRVETDLLSLYPQFTSNTATGGSSAMDEARVDGAETALFNAYVPDTQAKYLVLSGNAYSQARQLSRFTEYQTGVNRDQASPIQTGTLTASLKSFTVLRSQLVAKPSSTTYNLAFSRDAIALAVRLLPLPMPGTGAIGSYGAMGGFAVRVIMSYQPNALGTQFTVDTLYGCGVLRQSFGVVVQSN